MIFLTALNLLVWHVISSCIYHLWYKTTQRMSIYNDNANDAFYGVLNTQDVTSFILPVYALIATLFTSSLYFFHIYLICVGQTTNERLKESFPFGSPYARNPLLAFFSLCWRFQTRRYVLLSR